MWSSGPVPHDDAAGVARQPLRCLRGNARAFDHRLARRVGIDEHGRVDMNDNLVALSRCSRLHPMVERRLREQGERVRLLLAPCRRAIDDEKSGRRSRGNVWSDRRAREYVGGDDIGPAALLIQRLPRRTQRPHHHGARLGFQSSAYDDHAVFVLMHVQRAEAMSLGRLMDFGVAIDRAPGANDALDVRGCSAPADG
jgi:hypothetical protein